jgi:arsenite methyltransferase
MTPDADDEKLRGEVRSHYAAVARNRTSCCQPGCCTPGKAIPSADLGETALGMGYTADQLSAVPQGANLGLGCGNPHGVAALRAGETVLDLGSGGGLDCFLAARKVGPQGRVIGVDMTPDMVSRARDNARTAGISNVEFRLGEIEHLPVADQTVDAILSNCVINLSPDKAAVFREAFRALRPGGRLAISDVVALRPVPLEIRRDLALYTGCLAGAATIEDTSKLLEEAGFVDIQISVDEQATKAMARITSEAEAPPDDFASLAASAQIEARKPTSEPTARA